MGNSSKPRIRSGDKFAFWTYDIYPYTLGGKIDPSRTKPNGAVYVPSFQAYFHAFAVVSGVAGAKLKADLDALSDEKSSADKETAKLFRARLNARLARDGIAHPNKHVSGGAK